MGATITGAGGSRFPDNTFTVFDDADPTKTLVLSLGGATTAKVLTLASSHTLDRTVTIPDFGATAFTPNNTLAVVDVSDGLFQTYTGEHRFDSTVSPTPGSLVFKIDPASGVYPFSFLDSVSGFKVQFNLTQQTVGDGIIRIPNMAGAAAPGDDICLVSLAQTLGNKTLGTTCLVRTQTSSVGFSFADNTTLTKRLRLVCSSLTASTNNSMTFIGTAVRDWQFEDCTGSLAITGNENKTTATNASANRVAKFNLTGQTATIAATNITTTTAAGFYQINANVACTVAGTGSLSVNLAWTGDGGAKTTAIISGYSMTATGTVQQATFVVYLASGNITFTVTGTFTGTYALRLRATYLGP